MHSSPKSQNLFSPVSPGCANSIVFRMIVSLLFSIALWDCGETAMLLKVKNKKNKKQRYLINKHFVIVNPNIHYKIDIHISSYNGCSIIQPQTLLGSSCRQNQRLSYKNRPAVVAATIQHHNLLEEQFRFAAEQNLIRPQCNM